ncbi:coiled-coil domain-containing protein R3HCC1L-like [Physella acuta]|uniref:coiled-coil domain-containing protein R3HCC1L-like n=1 Tax=Physella acuta TaxID=109671 RepID=UPI0027DB3534|nr:coiled-coil domain-containing protein R3HCC1L-like [Physella acuta]XP_059142019.1 coiled-coil domain-containing protein R3HCC1L-like [Physella acuta]XP_059142020.1 coiled-coil domain-containing protein R3HCC1L-like [Physella acuta]
MNSPTPPISRGRGRGRGKELTSSERVSQWVNQRETKRLNKEKWANPSHQTVFDALSNDSDVQNSEKQNSESDSSSERSKAKRSETQLYIPPYLREKKASSQNIITKPSAEAPYSNIDEQSLSNNLCEDTSKVSEVPDTQDITYTKDNVDNLTEAVAEVSKSKGRGRGKRKPEVEIYVPRALRTVKNESKPGTDKVNETISCDNQDYSEAFNLHEQIKEDDFNQQCVNSVEIMKEQVLKTDQQCKITKCVTSDVSSGCETIEEILINSKHKTYFTPKPPDVEPVISIENLSQNQPEEKDISDISYLTPAVSENVNCTSCDDKDTPGTRNTDSFTFEFYDPAVIAFLPSSPLAQQTNDDSYFVNKTDISSPATIMSAEQCPESDLFENCQNDMLDAEKIQFNNFNNNSATTPTDTNIEMIEKDEQNNMCVAVQNIELDETLNTESKVCTDTSKLIPDSNPESSDKAAVHKSKKKQKKDGSPSVDGKSVKKASKEKSSTKEKKKRKEKPEQVLKEAKEQSVSAEKTEEEDTWDALFDDNGDCLNDSLMKELTEYVGKVEIEKPKINYLKFEPKEPSLDYQAFSHIVEIYDFSEQLQTCDLVAAFRDFSSRGFDVKWVDDTHALGIFSSSVAANEALKMVYPLLKVRPMSEASKKGQQKAQYCQEFLQPYKARPETTSIAARRLVAGALGMAPRVSREVRDQERQKLKEAKEKRRQERQQKNDIWDGTVAKSTVDEEAGGLS